MTDAREVMSWDDLGAGSRALAEAVHNDGWIPDLVLGISRGGLLVAGAIAYALGIKNTATIGVEFFEKSRSTVASEYVWRRTDRWITFPWSALPSVGGDEAE